MNRWPSLIASIGLVMAAMFLAEAGHAWQDPRPDLPANPKNKKSQGGPKHVFTGPAPAHPFDVVLARPTDRSIVVSVLSSQDREGYLTYGVSGRTPLRRLDRDRPTEFVLESLKPDTRYGYRLHTREAGTKEFNEDAERSFRTARRRGSPFRFAVQADSHLDQGTSPAVYERTLANIEADGNDFLIDLGDTFMTDKYPSHQDALPQYIAQRYYLGLASRSSPLFLVLGNHDGERVDRFNGRADSMPAWSNLTRRKYFPTPEPDAFYTGNRTPLKPLGRLANYYAWEWGDALFVVLDPFWTSGRRPREAANGNWARTLGEEQYRWLSSTLAGSKARFKFVFIHHLVGGTDESARGGLEAAGLYEWGGHGDDGRDEFEAKRPGWGRPIHRLLVENKVSAVFHGHDHFFARQERDGVTYLLVPQPGFAGGERLRGVAEYGYKTGDFLPSSGYVRVSVETGEAVVDYVRTTLPTEETPSKKNGRVDFSFRIVR